MSTLALSDKITSFLSRVESGESTAEETLTIIHDIAAFSQAAAELKRKAEAATIAWIDLNGELNDGERRWYVGVEKKEKCIDIAKTLTALIEAKAGDVDGVAQYLTSDPFKAGACGSVIDRDTHFKSEYRKDLKEGANKGNLIRKLKVTKGNNE